VYEYGRWTFAEEAIVELDPVDRDLSRLHVISVAADIRSGTRYRLDMAENGEPDKARAIAGLAGSGEEAIRNLVALPLRMLAGTLGIFEAALHTAADTLREIDPVDERIVELERRVDSLEGQTTSRPESARSTSAARKSAPTASAAAEPDRSASPDPAPG
jgi:hypothetical protein